MQVRRVVLTALLASTAWVPCVARAEDPPPAKGAASRPVFELDGKPFEPRVLSLNGDPEHPSAGDIVFVDGIPLALGEGREFRFRTTDEEKDGRVYLQLPGGAERVVGARTKWTLEGRNNEFVVRNLLEPLGDEEMHGLWGVHLDGWNDAVAAKVAKIDPARTCVALTDSSGGPGRDRVRRMPALPAGVRALILGENSSEGMTDLSPLAAQDALVLFATSGNSRVPLDLGLLRSSAGSIRHLRLGRATLPSPEVLATFTALRELDVRGSRTVTDLGFALGLTELRRIDLAGTAVEDLRPLGGLARLEVVHADASKVGVLPSGPLPALRTLRVMAAGIQAPAAAEFARAHPNCRVWHGWNETLHRELAAADRVVVRSGGLCHRDVEKERTLIEVPGAVKVKEFLGLFEMQESNRTSHCMCCGDPSFEFYRGKELIGSLGFHHGKTVRWPGGWPGDGPLAPQSADRLIEWLAANGAPEAKNARDKTVDEDALRAKEEADFLCRFPEGVREFFRTEKLGDDPFQEDEKKVAAFAAAMAERCGGAEALARCLCRALGESTLEWTVSQWKETRATAALGAVSGDAFAAALVTLENDVRGLCGAARLAFQEGMLSKMSPEARGEWAPRLANYARGYGEPSYAWKIARALGDADSEASRKFLWRYVEKPNPPGEKDSPSLAAAALISLAKLGDPKAGEQVRQRLPAATDPVEKMALEVALALLGERKVLRPQHFSGRSSAVVFGAMDAVERSPRREGIEAMVAAMQLGDVHFGFDLAQGFFRATGWSFPIEGAYPSVHEKCLAWWKENGEAFLKKHREGE